MSTHRPALAGILSAICAVGSMYATPAQAATATLTESSITRQTGLRDQSKNPMWINRDDCLADDIITFPLYVTEYAGLPMEVWAGGVDCKDKTARQGTAPSCWIVGNSAVPTSASHTVQVRVRDIVGQHKPPDTTKAGAGTLEDCTPESGTSSAPVGVTLFFMFVDQASNEQQGGVSWATKYDLVGPSAASGLTLGQGDTMLKLDWTASTDTDLSGYQFFCDPPRGSEGAGANTTEFEAGAGTGAEPEPAEASVEEESCDPEDAGEAGCPEASTEASTTETDSGSGTTPEGNGCPTSNLFAGEIPDAKFYCGSVSGLTATSGKVTGLVNNTTYSIAIAGVDTVGNVGRLSNVQCAQPSPVDDFFKLYKEAGGEAGGGFCSTGAVGHRAGTAALLMMSVAALARVVRRRRKDA